MIKGIEAARIAAAYATAGAKWTPIFRQPRDLNDMPEGDPERIGCMLGLLYRKGSSSTIKIDIPGIVLNADVDRFEGVLAAGCGEIRENDLICIRGTKRRILSVQDAGGIAYVLTLSS